MREMMLGNFSHSSIVLTNPEHQYCSTVLIFLTNAQSGVIDRVAALRLARGPTMSRTRLGQVRSQAKMETTLRYDKYREYR